MSGICSRHRGYEADCKLCNSTPYDLFPDWGEKLEQAKTAPRTTCENCGFVYFNIAFCPCCNHGYNKERDGPFD